MVNTLRKTMVSLSLTIAVVLSSLDHPLVKTEGGTQDYVVAKLGFVVETMTTMVLGASPAFVRSLSVSSIVTQDFFDGIINNQTSRESCPWMNLYTRDAFLSAVTSYPRFGTTGSSDDSKREIAAFFANLVHETRRFCSKEENNGALTNNAYYDATNTEYPSFDWFNNPKISANDAVTSFKSALWFWMNNIHSVMNQGFGAAMSAINGALECNGQNPDEANARIQLYQNYCSDLGVDPGQNLSC